MNEKIERDDKCTAKPIILTQEVRSEDKATPAMLDERQERLVGALEMHEELEVLPTDSVSGAADTTTVTQRQA